jgi:hypothetical protein
MNFSETGPEWPIPLDCYSLTRQRPKVTQRGHAIIPVTGLPTAAIDAPFTVCQKFFSSPLGFVSKEII